MKQDQHFPRLSRQVGVMIAGATVAYLATAVTAHAQQRIALKSGESVDLGTVYYITNCKSIMIGLPEIEILEAPEDVILTLREEMVLPRRFNCPKRVPGGTLVLTAKVIKEPGQSQLTYRVKYKTKDGPRQLSAVYDVLLYP